MVHDQVFELFFNLDATEEQLDLTTVHGFWRVDLENQPKDYLLLQL